MFQANDPSTASQAALQEDVLRFSGLFADRVMQAAAVMNESPAPDHEIEVLRRSLLYVSSALDIATGQLPEVNLLDMLVFVTLTRESFEGHFMPSVFGSHGAAMLEALASSEQDIWGLAEKYMDEGERDELRGKIRDFRARNPEQVRVEGIRLSDFSEVVGDFARATSKKGVLGSMKAATQAADAALMLGERAMFLVQRAPFLVRLQTRLAVQELTADLSAQLIPRAASHLDALVRRWLGYVAVLGLLLIIVFWLGYYLVRG